MNLCRRPGLPMTVSGVERQGTCGNCDTAGLRENKRRKRGERRAKRQRELWKGRRTFIRVGTLNVGTMAGWGTELADMIGAKKSRCTVLTGNKVERK